MPAVGPELADPQESIGAGDLAPSQARALEAARSLPPPLEGSAGCRCAAQTGIPRPHLAPPPRPSYGTLQHHHPRKVSVAPRVGWNGWTPLPALGPCRMSPCIAGESEGCGPFGFWATTERSQLDMLRPL